MSKRTNEFHQVNIQRKRFKYVKPISTFESMPNELFMELFEYFDLYSLYHTFYSLNTRLNAIICHCQVHVDFNQINPLDFTSFIGYFINTNINKGQIRSLQSSIPHQIAVLVNDIVMDRFAALRSLTLSRCSIDLVVEILNKIDQSTLEKISISSCKRLTGRRCSLTQHLLSTARYPSLRSIHFRLCTRELVDLTDVEITTERLTRLEYLSFDKSAKIEDLSYILHLSPNLQSLNTVITNLTDHRLISTRLTNSLMLSRLKLTSSIIQRSTLEYLLGKSPNLTYLYLDFSTKSSELVDSQYWMDSFEKIHQLQHVYIRMIIQLFETNLSQEQVSTRVKLIKWPWMFTRNLINRKNTIRIFIH